LTIGGLLTLSLQVSKWSIHKNQWLTQKLWNCS